MPTIVDHDATVTLLAATWDALGALCEPLDEAAWKADLALLGAEHRALVAAVAERLPALAGAARAKALHLVRGVAAHDLYHAGQVQLHKKLRPRG